MSTTLRGLADRYNAFVARHEIAWELTMAAFAVLFVVVGFMLDDAPPGEAGMLEMLDLGLTGIFIAEFATRFAAARSRRAYLRGHWIDLVALIPTVRGLRLLRLVRLLRLIRAFAGVYRALVSIERFAGHRSLLILFVSWLATAVICGAALYVAEVGVNDAIQEPLDALWWSIVTLTTVGYGDVFPVTPEGRIAAAALMIIGITLWAAITGTITSLLLASKAADVGIPEQIRQLADLRRDELVSDDEFEAKRAELLGRM